MASPASAPPTRHAPFLDLLSEVGCQRDVAFWLLHHINKARHSSIVQALSGDWGGHPDTILGVEHKEGERRTVLTFGKVRWGDQGKKPLILEWLPTGAGIGYQVVDVATSVALGQNNRARVLNAIRQPDTTATEIADELGLSSETVRKHLKKLAADSEIELTGTGKGETLRASPKPESPEEGLAQEELL